MMTPDTLPHPGLRPHIAPMVGPVITPLRWSFWALLLGFWLVFSLFGTGMTIWATLNERPEIATRAFFLYLATYLFYLPILPVIGQLARRFPLTRPTLARDLGVHVVALLCVVAASVAFNAWLYARWWPWPAGEHPALGVLALRYFQSRSQYHPLIYGAVLAVVRAVSLARDAHDRELQSAQLQGQLAQAQVATLRMQLNPHFLFNTLQAISTLVEESPAGARRMLVLLGDLLRTTLEDARAEIPLRQELELLRRYLDIELVRFPDRLRVSFDIAPEVGEALVPSFLLQPLMENAIRHGVAPRAGVGLVSVTARVEGGRLLLIVTDNGRGIPLGARDGVGLRATRARLDKRYGTAHRFTLEAASGGGTMARIELPLLPAGDG